LPHMARASAWSIAGRSLALARHSLSSAVSGPGSSSNAVSIRGARSRTAGRRSPRSIRLARSARSAARWPAPGLVHHPYSSIYCHTPRCGLHFSIIMPDISVVVGVGGVVYSVTVVRCRTGDARPPCTVVVRSEGTTFQRERLRVARWRGGEVGGGGGWGGGGGCRGWFGFWFVGVCVVGWVWGGCLWCRGVVGWWGVLGCVWGFCSYLFSRLKEAGWPGS